jgi:hypothetical protein
MNQVVAWLSLKPSIMKLVTLPVFLFGIAINFISCVTTKNVNSIPDMTSPLSPLIAGHSDGLVHLFACTTDGHLKENRSNKPGIWSGWSSLINNASTRIAPVLIRLEEQKELYLFVLTNENNICVIKKTDRADWSSQHILTGISGSSANFSAAITNNGSIYHLLYQENGGMRYNQFNQTQLLKTLFFPGVKSGKINALSQYEIGVSVLHEEYLQFYIARENSGWNFNVIGARQTHNDLETGNTIAQSDIIPFNGKYHIAFTYRFKGNTVNHFTYNIEHLQFGEISNELPIVKRIAFIPDTQDRPLLTCLCLYRGKLFAFWSSRLSGDLGWSYWDNLDDEKNWVTDAGLSLPGTGLVMSAGSFDKKKYTRPDYDNDYGNDLLVAVTQTNNSVYVDNFSRSLSKVICNNQFDLYEAKTDTCHNQQGPLAPEKVNIQDSKKPFVSELGFTILMFPDWFINGYYKRFAYYQCSSGAWGGFPARSGPPCNSRKLPILITPDDITPFFCQGVWNYKEHDYLRIYEELGHYMAIELGLGSNQDAPAQRNADETHISLQELNKASSIFIEGTGDVDYNRRVPGFLKAGGYNYDRTGREHSFLYSVYYFISRSAEFRQYIQEDLAIGNTLLKRKYDWVKKNIFRDNEF